jgi:drug/metabolite transporter (DMT)-like permease
MQGLPANVRGIIYMVLSAGTFVINDTFLKLATEGLPPFQTLFLRGISAAIWCLPLVLYTGNIGRLHLALDRWVLLRNLSELGAVLCFIVALKQVPLADITAINMTAPLLLLIGCAIFFRERLGLDRGVLVAIGFIGALLVAQPSGQDASPYLLLGFVCAALSAGRDLLGRRIGGHVPTMVVAYAVILTVMTGAGIAHFAFEAWQVPSMQTIFYLAGSGFFLVGGQFFLFLSYRTGETGVVAPFIYMFAVWAVISGLVVFGTLPNLLALAGIALIIASGVTIALLDERRRRLTVTA